MRKFGFSSAALSPEPSTRKPSLRRHQAGRDAGRAPASPPRWRSRLRPTRRIFRIVAHRRLPAAPSSSCCNHPADKPLDRLRATGRGDARCSRPPRSMVKTASDDVAPEDTLRGDASTSRTGPDAETFRPATKAVEACLIALSRVGRRPGLTKPSAAPSTGATSAVLALAALGAANHASMGSGSSERRAPVAGAPPPPRIPPPVFIAPRAGSSPAGRVCRSRAPRPSRLWARAGGCRGCSASVGVRGQPCVDRSIPLSRTNSLDATAALGPTNY